MTEQVFMKNLDIIGLIQSTPIIGIDIDGVLADTVATCLKKAYEDYQLTLTYLEWKHWNPHENKLFHARGITKQQHTIDFFHDVVYRHHIPPIDGAIEGIQSLKKINKSLIALTGRSEDVRVITEEFIIRYFPNTIKKVTFCNHDIPELKQPKSRIAKENGIGMMIEDNIFFAIELATNDIPVILLSQPWNQDIDIPKGLRIYRVQDWKEIISYITFN